MFKLKVTAMRLFLHVAAFRVSLTVKKKSKVDREIAAASVNNMQWLSIYFKLYEHCN